MDAAANIRAFPAPPIERWIEEYRTTYLASKDKATVEAYPTAKAVDVAGDSLRTNTSSADLELSMLRAYLEAAEAYNAARTDLPECIGVWFLGYGVFPRWDARVPSKGHLQRNASARGRHRRAGNRRNRGRGGAPRN